MLAERPVGSDLKLFPSSGSAGISGALVLPHPRRRKASNKEEDQDLCSSSSSDVIQGISALVVMVMMLSAAAAAAAAAAAGSCSLGDERQQFSYLLTRIENRGSGGSKLTYLLVTPSWLTGKVGRERALGSSRRSL